MKDPRSIAASLVVSAVMSGTTLIYAIPAFADTPSLRAVCATGYTCGYNGGQDEAPGSYEGLLDAGKAGETRSNMVAGIRDRLSSWKNNSGTGAAFYYRLTGDGGTCVPMYRMSQASASAGNPDNNQAESWRFNRLC